MKMLYRNRPEIPLADNITFVITDDCNLRCLYCYEKNKQPHDMTIETAMRAVDYFLERFENKFDRVVFDFVGGEPFVRIDLLEELLPYMIERLKNQDKWQSFIFGFSTNGTCFSDPRVRSLIEKYREHMSIGLSLDGVKKIHDYNRSDSFDEVMKWFGYWRKIIPWGTTKSTLNHEAIPYLFESVKFLINTCLEDIFMNTVYEDVWQEGDAQLYEKELIKSADYILERGIYKKKYISLFDIGLLMEAPENRNWCGCGSCMIAVDWRGDLFPCLRFKTLSKQAPKVIGDITNGISYEQYKQLISFYLCHNTRKTPDCEHCEARAGCPNCTAFCYDETGSIFDRVSYMCDMHRARKRANEYYWGRMAEIEHVTLEELMKNEIPTRQ